jgi:hypothetical protein
MTRWEEDYQLIDSEGLFQEYLEMGELPWRDVSSHFLGV